MAKRKTRPVQKAKTTLTDGQGYYTTTLGKRMKMRPVSQIKLKRVQASVEFPPAPTKKIETVTGETEEFELDEETAETDEEKKAVADHKAEVARLSEILMDRVVRLIFDEGVDLEMEDEKGQLLEWAQERLEIYGIAIPESGWELKKEYIEDELVGDPAEDFTGVILAQGEILKIDHEVLAAARNSFRGDVRPNGTDSETAIASD